MTVARRATRTRRARTLLCLLALALMSGCSFLRPARTPMERVVLREQGPDEARGAIVLLPGFGDRPSAFSEHGFAQALAAAAPGYDVFAADAHFGYYRKRSLLERLERDVIAPLRARGYRELWLAGASLGGFGAVGYARTHPERIAGLMLFAPYMGPKEVVSKVAQGGLCAYDETPSEKDDEANFARRNFVWLKRQACEDHSISLYVAVGDEDRLLGANRLLGNALPPSHALVLPGGHGWKVWTPAVTRLAPVAFDSETGSH